ncbi:hypothetical protein OA41_19190 [Klebsiella aerogenes]|nr:hypothetical protein OA41_19190 [Klebsiella aerogenes]
MLFFSVLHNAVPGRSEESKTIISILNSSPGSFSFSINVMMIPATIIHATPRQRRSLSLIICAFQGLSD